MSRQVVSHRSPCSSAAFVLAVLLLWTGLGRAQVCNLKVVTDASPDYTDMASLVHSITGNWQTDQEKCWALFYWNHIARRQTEPMHLHGMALTDPIMQFNDYGYTMCSTISGVNCSIWEYMGYPVKYYDIGLHTVPEVFYDGQWHHYDNSLSCVYTLCDGKTIAGVQDIGKTLACPASGGKEEPGHIALYHCLNGTSADGFLEGSDTMRTLRHLGEDSFNPEIVKYRSYYLDRERGHRYILNLRDGETYTRHYYSLGKTPEFYVPNSGVDPEAANERYRIRGNGVRTFAPKLTPRSLPNALHSSRNISVVESGIVPEKAGEMAEVVFKLEGANVITSVRITAELLTASPQDAAAISVSRNNGISWEQIWKADAPGISRPDLKLVEPVNGAYEVLVKVQLQAQAAPANAQLRSIVFQTTTTLNSKTQPRLNLGRNTAYVGAGEQSGSIVLWPELQAEKYRPMAVEVRNIRTDAQHEGWHGVMHSDGGEGFVTFRIDAPQDITRLTQSARMYVRTPGAEVRFEHSFDGGATWVPSYAFRDTAQPWDDLHDQVTTQIPAGVRSVLFRYILKDASLYSVRMEANHRVADATPRPLEVTFNWSERQKDYSLVKRSHTQLIEKLPATYTLNVGGADHPVVESLTINPRGARGPLTYGYSDGQDVGGEKSVGRWVNYGTNLAQGKPYTCTVASVNQWDAAPADKVLTDGIVGPPYCGGTSYRTGALWTRGSEPVVTIDLGRQSRFAALRVQLAGYEFKDAVRGEIQDKVEVLTSADGKAFTSQGFFDFALRWKNVPVNYMWTDEETFYAHNFTKELPQPVEARYVQFKVTPTRFVSISEMQVLDHVETRPFDLRIALPQPGR